MPRQARRAALRVALSDKLAAGQLTVVEALQPAEPKTKVMVGLLRGLGVTGEPTLLVVAELTDALDRSSRNISWLSVVRPNQVHVTDVVRHPRIVFERQALVRLQETLSS
jgi:large subunit ribosomal protein L4